jgi:hypothetical protein
MNDQSQHFTDVKIRSLTAKPLDENRIKASLMLDETDSKANLVFILIDANNRELSRAVILDNGESQIEFTLHLRQKEVEPPISLTCTVYQNEEAPLDSLTIQIL